jgi:hypothetical protein
MPPTLRLARLAATLLAVAATSLAARGAAAQQAGGMGTVRGRAYAAADRAPVAYALIRLSPVGAPGPGRTALSDAQGAFTFAAVAPGTYRLTLERIGYSSERSEPFAVASGETVERNLASRPNAIALQALVATPECRTAADLDRNPRLAALWNEARKSLETSRAFADGYVYTYQQRQYWSTDADDAPLDSLITNVANDPRLPWPNRDRAGWGRATQFHLRLEVPDGREILDPAFLTTHCLEGDASQTDDGFEIGFRPVRARGGRIDIRGVVRVDRRSLQMKEIELEYLDGRTPFLQATIVYQDAVVPGGIVRLPMGMTFTGTPPRQVLMRPVRGQIQFVNYTGLTKVDSAGPPPR